MSQRLTKGVYWGSTGVLSALMLLSGCGDLIRFKPFAEDLLRLGYPDYLLTILGIAKLAGVGVLLSPGTPRLKEWAYAGLSFDLGGATISQVVSGSSMARIMFPALCGSLVALSYIAYRAGGRGSQIGMRPRSATPNEDAAVAPRTAVHPGRETDVPTSRNL